MQPCIFDEILEARVDLKYYLKEKNPLEHYQQLSFKSFVKLFSIPKLLSKVSTIQITF